MKEWIRQHKWALALGTPAGLIAVGIVSGLLYLQTSSFEQYAKSQISQMADESINGTLEVGRLKGSFVNSIRLQNIYLEDDAGQLLAHIPEASAEYSLWGLASGEFSIRSVKVREPFIFVERTDSGLNWSDLVKPSEQGTESSYSIFVDSFDLKGGDVVYLDRAKQGSPMAERLKAGIKSFRKEGRSFIGLESLDVERSQPPAEAPGWAVVRNLAISGNASVQKDSIRAELRSLDADFHSDLQKHPEAFGISGLTGLMEDETVSVGLDKLSVADASVLSSISFGAKMAESMMESTAELTVERLHLPSKIPEVFYLDLPLQKGVQADIQLDWDDRRASFESTFGCVDTDGDIEVSGNSSFEPKIDYEFDIQANNFAISTCLGELTESRLEGELSARGEGIPYRSRGKLNLKGNLTGSTVLGERLKQFEFFVENRDKHIEIREFSMKLPWASLNGTGRLRDKQRVEMTLSAKGHTPEKSPVSRFPVSVRNFKADAKIDGFLKDEPLQHLNPLERIDVQFDWSMSGIRGSGFRVYQTRGRLRGKCKSFDGSGCHRGFGLELQGGLSGMRMLGGRVGQISVDSRMRGRFSEVPNTIDDALSLTEALRGGLKLDIRDLDVAGTQLRDVSATTSIQPEMTDRLSVDLQAEGLEISGFHFPAIALSGGYNKKGGGYQLALRTRQDFRGAPLSSQLEGTILPDPLGVTVQRGHFELLGRMYRLRSLEGPLKLTTSGVQTNEFEVAGDNGWISLQGNWDFGGAANDIRLAGKGLSLSVISELAPFPMLKDSELSFRFRARGSSAEPDLNGQIDLSRLDFGRLGAYNGHLQIWVENRVIELNSWATFAGDRGLPDPGGVLARLRMSLPFTRGFPTAPSLHRTKPINLALSVPGLSLEKLPRRIPAIENYEIGGDLSMGLALKGTYKSPKIAGRLKLHDFRARGDIAGSDYRVSDLDWVSSLYLDSDSSSSKRLHGLRTSVEWKNSEIISGRLQSQFSLGRWYWRTRGDIQKTRRFFRDKRYSANVSISEIDVGQIAIAELEDAKSEGKLLFNLESSGKWDNPSGKLKFDLNDFGFGRFRDIYLNVDTSLSDWFLSLNKLRFEWDKSKILTGSGKIPLRFLWKNKRLEIGDFPVQLSIDLNRLKLSKLSAFDYTFAKIPGKFGGSLDVGGTLNSIELDGEFGIFETKFGQKRPGDISLEFGRTDKHLTVTLLTEVNQEMMFELSGDIPVNFDLMDAWYSNNFIAKDRTFDLRFKTDEMGLEKLIPELLVDDYIRDVSGDVTSDARLYGRLGELKLGGRFQLVDGSVVLPSMGRQFSEIDLDVAFEGNRVNAKRIRIADDEGDAKFTGEVWLENLAARRFDVNLKTDEFNIAGIAGNIEAYLDSNIDMTGTLDDKLNQIEVVSKKLAVHLPQSQSKAVYPMALNKDIRVKRNGYKWGLNPNLLVMSEGAREPPTRTEVTFKTANHGWLYHPNAEISFNTDLVIRLAEGEQRMTGEIDTEKGTLEFVGKEFSVPKKKGAIQFNGRSPPVPTLDIEAMYQISQGVAAGLGESTSGVPHITVGVRGAATEPQLELTSDPAMSETEIIFVLVTGRPPSNAKAGEEQSAASQAVSAASGLFSGLVQQELSGSIPVDVLRLQTGDKGLQNSRLQIGTYLSNNVFVSYYYQFGFGGSNGESTHIGQMEYRFAPRWEWETRYTDTGSGSVFVFWDIY